jgi:hypothetical protein
MMTWGVGGSPGCGCVFVRAGGRRGEEAGRDGQAVTMKECSAHLADARGVWVPGPRDLQLEHHAVLGALVLGGGGKWVVRVNVSCRWV